MTAHYQDAWTPEERELVAKLWKQGLSAANVAVKVKTRRTNRNAIIGLVNRMGLQRPKADAWTPEERELVAKLWKQGLSAANVAVNVKTRRASRNAIIGLVNRMGLQRPKAAVCATRTYTCRANAGVAKINARVDHLPRQILSQPPRLLRLVAAPDHLPTLDTRERHACCRPIGDVPKGSGAEQRFCGAPRPATRLYCDACAAELFQPLTAEQKRRHGRMVSWLGARG